MIMLTVLNYDALNRSADAPFSSSSRRGNSYSAYYSFSEGELISRHESINEFFSGILGSIHIYNNIGDHGYHVYKEYYLGNK